MADRLEDVTDLLRITDSVRRLFHRMGNVLNEWHKDVGVSARMRAVMESISEFDKTVPAIASEKEVTRQHIQTIVNELLDAGLVRKRVNPEHKRSPLISLTSRGKSILEKILKREAELLPKMARELSHLNLRNTAETLEELHEYFGSELFELIQQTRKGESK